MKTKIILYFNLFILLSSNVYGQNLTVKYVPGVSGPYWYGQTVNFTYTFFVGDEEVDPICSRSISVQNNQGGTTSTAGLSGQQVNVTWGSQTSTTARVNISHSNCNTFSHNGNFPSNNYTVLSITGVTPATISSSLGTNNIPICHNTPITFSTQPMAIPN